MKHTGGPPNGQACEASRPNNVSVAATRRNVGKKGGRKFPETALQQPIRMEHCAARWSRRLSVPGTVFPQGLAFVGEVLVVATMEGMVTRWEPFEGERPHCFVEQPTHRLETGLATMAVLPVDATHAILVTVEGPCLYLDVATGLERVSHAAAAHDSCSACVWNTNRLVLGSNSGCLRLYSITFPFTLRLLAQRKLQGRITRLVPNGDTLLLAATASFAVDTRLQDTHVPTLITTPCSSVDVDGTVLASPQWKALLVSYGDDVILADDKGVYRLKDTMHVCHRSGIRSLTSGPGRTVALALRQHEVQCLGDWVPLHAGKTASVDPSHPRLQEGQ